MYLHSFENGKVKYKTRFCDFILLFFLLIGPTVTVGISINTGKIIRVLIAFYTISSMIVEHRGRIQIPRDSIIRCSIILAYYCLIIYLLNECNDSTWIKFIGMPFVNIFITIYLCKKYKEHYKDRWIDAFFDYLCIIFIIDSIYVIGAYFLPSVRAFGYNFLDASRYRDFQFSASYEAGKRSFDIGIGTGAEASIGFASVFIISVCLAMENRRPIYVITAVLVFIATIFLGRTGVVVNCIVLAFLVLHKPFKVLKLLGSPKILCSLIGIAIIGVLGLHCIRGTNLYNKFFAETLPWLLEGYYNFQSTRKISTGSTDAVLNKMYFLPDSLSHVFFGNANLGRNSIYGKIKSDVGYIRVIFGFGLIGIVLTYYPLLLTIIRAFKSKSNIKLILILLLTMVLVVNIKELHYLGEMYGILIFVLMFRIFDYFSDYKTL